MRISSVAMTKANDRPEYLSSPSPSSAPSPSDFSLQREVTSHRRHSKPINIHFTHSQPLQRSVVHLWRGNHFRAKMIQLILLRNNLNSMKGQTSLQHTNDGLEIDFYDCVLLRSLDSCRRSRHPINWIREKDAEECQLDGGQLHTFSELRSENITVSTLIEHWTFIFEQLEEYSPFLKDLNEKDGLICQCHQRGSFGKNCEYQLPVGQTFVDTLEWRLIMGNENQEKVQI